MKVELGTLRGFGAEINVSIRKGSDYATAKTCDVVLSRQEDSIVLGTMPVSEAFDFAELITTGFQIFNYTMELAEGVGNGQV